MSIQSALARCVFCAALLIDTHAHAAPAPAGAHGTSAQLILAHGRIYTLDPAAPWAEAVAISNGRITAVGSDPAVLRLRSAATHVIDLHGNLLTPGLIDSHVHFVDGGRYLRNVPLRDATTYTLGAAYASRAETQEGSIVVGKRADLAAFSRDFLESPATEIPDAHVVLTLVGGKIVYDGM